MAVPCLLPQTCCISMTPGGQAVDPPPALCAGRRASAGTARSHHAPAQQSQRTRRRDPGGPLLCRLAGPEGGREDRCPRHVLTACEQLTCGCHVHVSVGSDEEGVAVLDRIRSWLPSLMALSSNSPFWNGTDSGYASFRSGNGPKWFPRAVATPAGNPGEGRTCVARIGFPSSLPPVSRALGYLDGDARVVDHYWGSFKMPVDGASWGRRKGPLA
jgi:hypothetical protein